MKYSDFNQALNLYNAVGASLASSIFMLNLQETEHFLSK